MMWLGLKYAPLAAIVAGFYLMRVELAPRLGLIGLSAVAAASYVWFHIEVYDHLTAYNINSVYQGASTAAVLDHHVAFQERVYRVWGLLVDRRFGLGHWSPLLLCLPAALPLLAARGSIALCALLLILVQAAIATFVAITMMGWWFPGRTLMSVLPLFALALTLVAIEAPRWLRTALAALGAWSLMITVALWSAGSAGEVQMAVEPWQMSGALFRVIDGAFPDYRAWTSATVLLTAVWLAFFLGTAGVTALKTGHFTRRSIRPKGIARRRIIARDWV
jgi:hypothetical protein